MLIQPTVGVNDIASIKLSNGDEIVAKITDITDQTVTVYRPLLMVLSQDPRTGQPGVQMAPFWIMGGDKDSKYPINRAHIICMLKTNKDAASNYTETTTGLKVPASGLIT
jgi:hypothetical protein